MTIITGPILDSAGQPANGYLYLRQTSRFTSSEGLVTQAAYTAEVVAGVPLAADRGGALQLVPSAESTALEIVEDFRDGKTTSLTVAVPALTTMTYAELVSSYVVVPATSGGEFVLPPWVSEILGARDQADAAASAAELAQTSAEAAEAGAITAAGESAASAAASAASAAEAEAAAAAAVAPTDTQLATLVGDPLSETAAALNSTYGQRVSMLAEGAAADGTTDDLAVFTAARTRAGAKGVVWFQARPGATSTTYFLAGSRPDLSGTQIEADPSVIIKVDENPNTRTLNFVTPVTIQNTVHGTTIRKPASLNLPREIAAAANVHPGHGQPTAQTLTTGWSGYAVSGALTFGTFTGTIAANLVSWGAAFASGQQGIVTLAEVGKLYEATFDAASGTPTAFLDVMSSDGVAKRATWSVGADIPRRVVNGSTVTDLPALGNGDAYELGAAGSIVIGVRLTRANRAEVFFNGLLVEAYDLGFTATRIGFSINSGASATTTIKDVVTYDESAPISARSRTVDVIGDSQGYAAWSPLSIAELLPVSAAGLPGGGDVSVRTNHSVSGSTTDQWAAGSASPLVPAASSLDFSGADFVLVVLATNDIQGSTAAATVTANLATIASAVVADGSRPIIGIPLIFTAAAVSGVTGVTTTNYAGGARIRGAIKRWAAANGYLVADANDSFGRNLGWLGDNIHPTAAGQAALARAFALAIGAAGGMTAIPVRRGWGRWTAIPSGWFANSWVADVNPAYRQHADGRVQFRGAIKSGVLGSVAINLGDDQIKPPETIRAVAACVTAATALATSLAVVTNAGAITFIGGDNNRVSLDGLGWSAV